MSDTAVTLTLRLERDDTPQAWCPLVDIYHVNHLQAFALPREGDDVYAPVPGEGIGVVQVLMLTPEGAVRLRLGGQTTSNVPLAARGLFLLWNGELLGVEATCAAATATRLTGWVGGV